MPSFPLSGGKRGRRQERTEKRWKGYALHPEPLNAPDTRILPPENPGQKEQASRPLLPEREKKTDDPGRQLPQLPTEQKKGLSAVDPDG